MQICVTCRVGTQIGLTRVLAIVFHLEDIIKVGLSHGKRKMRSVIVLLIALCSLNVLSKEN